MTEVLTSHSGQLDHLPQEVSSIKALTKILIDIGKQPFYLAGRHIGHCNVNIPSDLSLGGNCMDKIADIITQISLDSDLAHLNSKILESTTGRHFCLLSEDQDETYILEPSWMTQELISLSDIRREGRRTFKALPKVNGVYSEVSVQIDALDPFILHATLKFPNETKFADSVIYDLRKSASLPIAGSEQAKALYQNLPRKYDFVRVMINDSRRITLFNIPGAPDLLLKDTYEPGKILGENQDVFHQKLSEMCRAIGPLISPAELIEFIRGCIALIPEPYN